MTISYDTQKSEIICLMAEHPNMALATSAAGRTTCRMISCVTEGLVVYFQTSAGSLKFGNASLEGAAEILGHPLAEAGFRAAYEARHPGSFKRYSFLEEERVVRVFPRFVTLWKYIDGKPCQEVLDPVRLTAERIWFAEGRRLPQGGA
jgi:hypothetical protein